MVKAYQRLFLKLSDALLPEHYYISIGDFYGEDIKNAEDLFEYVKHIRNCTSVTSSYLAWTDGNSRWLSVYESDPISDQRYRLFESRGYYLKQCTDEEYDRFAELYPELTAYPKDGYITEQDGFIIVNFGS